MGAALRSLGNALVGNLTRFLESNLHPVEEALLLFLKVFTKVLELNQ